MLRALVALLIVAVPAVANAAKTYNEGTGGSWDCGKDANVQININDATFAFTAAVTGSRSTATTTRSRSTSCARSTSTAIATR